MDFLEIKEQLQDDKLTIEQAFQKLSNLGHCPNLLNDDSGRWAVSFEGFQNVVGDEPEDVHTSFFVEAEKWHKNIKEALLFSLNEQ